jgi:chemotaxis protein methyltransferase CheR
LSPGDLEFVCALVRVRSGLVLTGERGFFAETRLSPLARREGVSSVTELVQRLKTGGDERLLRAVVEAMLIQDTAFFRDRAVFRALQDDVLPTLAASRGRALRVWSAGCASGQEPFSLAMTADAAPVPLELDIFASDLSSAALEKAESGLYTHFEVQRGLPIRSLLRYFEPVDDAWRIVPKLRQTIRWRRLNLVDDFSVGSPFDLILCRNVLEGLETTIKAKVVAGLTRALAPGGLLLLGCREAPPAGYQAAGVAGLYRSLRGEDIAEAAA